MGQVSELQFFRKANKQTILPIYKLPKREQLHKANTVKPINYTLDKPNKITFEFLKSHLWNAADILRGALDSSEYRQPIMTILFLKRLNDTFEENAEKLEKKQGKSHKEAWENRYRHTFFVPKDARWYQLQKSKQLRKIDGIFRQIQKEITGLKKGALAKTIYNDKKIL